MIAKNKIKNWASDVRPQASGKYFWKCFAWNPEPGILPVRRNFGEGRNSESCNDPIEPHLWHESSVAESNIHSKYKPLKLASLIPAGNHIRLIIGLFSMIRKARLESLKKSLTLAICL